MDDDKLKVKEDAVAPRCDKCHSLFLIIIVIANYNGNSNRVCYICPNPRVTIYYA